MKCTYIPTYIYILQHNKFWEQPKKPKQQKQKEKMNE